MVTKLCLILTTPWLPVYKRFCTVVQGVRLKCYYAFFLVCCGCDTSYIVSVHIQCQVSIYIPFVVSRAFMAGAASQAGDADSSRAPGLTSGLQGSVNVHRGALFLVPQWQCISYFVFYFIATYIFVNDCQCIIIMIIHTYVVYDSRRTLYDFGEKGKLVALTLHRFYVLKLAHPLLYDDDTLTHAANDIKMIFLIVGSKILDGRSWSYLDIELCTIFTHKRNNHYT